MNENFVTVLFIADIFGKPGLTITAQLLPGLREKYQPDLIVANGENGADGKGQNERVAQQFFDLGIDVVTGGNHIWDNAGVYKVWHKEQHVLRPANYPPGNAGRGSIVVQARNGVSIGVINLQGRTYMYPIDCPFRAADEILRHLNRKTRIVLIDFHAEATAEKMAFAWYLDGRVSAIIGTHTHVPTADERVLPGGTAYITDAGMTGPYDSVIGMRKEIAIKRFMRQIPFHFEPAEGDVRLCAVVIKIDRQTGKAWHIERLFLQ
ncbi:MAG: TIGR00282 family metallophosphoesterase [candidate division KSB1 bacterium]|nr:TIGR00282 family metallophosphoesterase [candidate division KSB1 bacterium]MDZ7365722.1 TIGR00282 family metallophosphoesterase [candidate division KSB1 bacterium]MDZ7403798.1 TIGR00282 family metallophosphoesterase [candidate division KSB1 bacterium]